MVYQLLVLAVFCLGIACGSKVDKQTTVVLQPLGKYNAPLTQKLQKTIQKYYGVNAIIAKAKPIPKSHFVNIKSPRYRADSIIHYLKETKPATTDYVLGFMDFDISTTKTDDWGRILEPKERYTDWGIMGLAYLKGPAGVVSTFRLRGNGARFEERAQKVTLHELGHMFGLPHCFNKKCFMTDAVESIKTIDNAQMDLCDACKEKIGLH